MTDKIYLHRALLPWQWIMLLVSLLAILDYAFNYLPAIDWQTWREQGGVFYGHDFANLYAGAKAAFAGSVAQLYDPASYQMWLESLYHPAYPPHEWSYPPHWLVMVVPLQWLPYGAAFVVYMLVTAAGLAWVAHRLCGLSKINTALLLVSPLAVINLWAGHNGMLLGMALLGAVFGRNGACWRSALFVLLLSIKPYLGLFVFLLYVYERRWRLMVICALAIVIVVGISMVSFGWEPWQRYVEVTSAQQWRILSERISDFLVLMTSPFAYARLAGWNAQTAMFLQTLQTTALLLWVVVLIRRRPTQQWLSCITIIATCLYFPYFFAYDTLPLLAVALLASQRQPAHGRYMVLAAALIWLPFFLLRPAAGNFPFAWCGMLLLAFVASRVQPMVELSHASET